MKKLLVLGLVAGASVSTLAGCGKTKEETVIKVQHHKDWTNLYKDIVKEFDELDTGFKIELVEADSFAMLDLLDKGNSVEGYADIITAPIDRMGSLAESGIIIPMDASKMKANGLTEDHKKPFTDFEGKQMLYPMNVESLIAFGHKDLKGDDEATGISASNQLTINFGDENTPANMFTPVTDFWMGALTSLTHGFEGFEYNTSTNQWGSRFITDDAERLALATDAVNWIKGMRLNEVNVQSVATTGEGDNKTYSDSDSLGTDKILDKDTRYSISGQAFHAGISSATIEGPWSINGIKDGWNNMSQHTSGAFGERNADEDLRAFPLNSFKLGDKTLKHWAGGWGIGINGRNKNASSKRVDAMYKFMDITMDKDNAHKWYAQGGKILPHADYSAFELSEFDKSVIEAVNSSFATNYKRGSESIYNKMWDQWQAAFDDIKPGTVGGALGTPEALSAAWKKNFETALDLFNQGL